MTYAGQKTALIREKRLGTLSAWYGSVGSLVREAAESGLVARIRSFAQDAPSDLNYALELLAHLEGIAIVVHGPSGCAAALQAKPGRRANWLVTKVNERDSILGGDAKLRTAIIDAHKRYAPKAIVVVSSPVVVINNDDIDSVVEELNDSLGVPIIPVYADGFRSKIGATGIDVVVHGLIKYLLPTQSGGGAQGHVNLLSFSENRANVASIENLLAELGLRSLVFPRYGNVEEAGELKLARLSLAINPAEAHYAGETLQQLFDVPQLNLPSPVGLNASANWLRAVGEVTGTSAQAERVVAREVSRLAGLTEAAGNLRGRKVFIHLTADHAFAFWRLAQELGLDVVGIKVPFLDPAHVPALEEVAASNEALPILVGEGQAFEEISLLKSAKPDLYIARAAHSIHAARLGLATLVVDELPYLGFSGFEQLLLQIERKLANSRFQRFLAEGETEPYTQNWRQKSAYWYIKHEVK